MSMQSMKKREMSFLGSFYSEDKNEINKQFDHFNTLIEKHLEVDVTIKPKAIIVPHAGYIYSGFTASIAYYYTQVHRYKSVVVIGPSHHHYFEGLSLFKGDQYATPFGNIEIDNNLCQELSETSQAHKEHSTEVQMPFIKKYLPFSKVTEIVYGNNALEKTTNLIDKFLCNEDILVVISTDLSHFHDLQEAKKRDNNCLEAIVKQDVKKLELCEACGIIGVTALLRNSQKHQLKSKLLDYRTSADTSKDVNRVVGYVSALFY